MDGTPIQWDSSFQYVSGRESFKGHLQWRTPDWFADFHSPRLLPLAIQSSLLFLLLKPIDREDRNPSGGKRTCASSPSPLWKPGKNGKGASHSKINDRWVWWKCQEKLLPLLPRFYLLKAKTNVLLPFRKAMTTFAIFSHSWVPLQKPLSEAKASPTPVSLMPRISYSWNSWREMRRFPACYYFLFHSHQPTFLCQRNVEAVKAQKIFFEGGTSNNRHPLFYYIARKFDSSQLDEELLIFTIFQTLKRSFLINI